MTERAKFHNLNLIESSRSVVSVVGTKNGTFTLVLHRFECDLPMSAILVVL